jgi:glutathione S-transferase
MKLNRKMLKAMSLLDIGRFLVDRINMGRKAKVRAVSPLKAKELVKAHIADLEQRLNQDFLFGQQPTHADFSTYHTLWFIHDLAESSLLQGHPRLLAWMGRMKALVMAQANKLMRRKPYRLLKAKPRAIAKEYRQDVH